MRFEDFSPRRDASALSYLHIVSELIKADKTVEIEKKLRDTSSSASKGYNCWLIGTKMHSMRSKHKNSEAWMGKECAACLRCVERGRETKTFIFHTASTCLRAVKIHFKFIPKWNVTRLTPVLVRYARELAMMNLKNLIAKHFPVLIQFSLDLIEF